MDRGPGDRLRQDLHCLDENTAPFQPFSENDAQRRRGIRGYTGASERGGAHYARTGNRERAAFSGNGGGPIRRAVQVSLAARWRITWTHVDLGTLRTS